jgi:2-keto-4-pentenoate hydratase/2-oxohepta-3-ene-1,7-dioic acid hydratase in catechol pathway
MSSSDPLHIEPELPHKPVTCGNAGASQSRPSTGTTTRDEKNQGRRRYTTDAGKGPSCRPGSTGPPPEFTHPLDPRVQTRANGELRQGDRTGTFIYRDLIAHLFRYHTLQAGDLACTGTPRGADVFSGQFLQAWRLQKVTAR